MALFLDSFVLLLVLLNPFILGVYMTELVDTLEFKKFAKHVVRAALFSVVTFIVFARFGETIFQDAMQIHFPSFLIFGGITFLIVGIRLILGVGPAIRLVKPDSDQISAAIAMPLIVGPGTISASVLAGARLNFASAAGAIALAVLVATLLLLAYKLINDYVRSRNERLVRQYTEIVGRAVALFTGSFAIEMIAKGVQGWVAIARNGV